MREVKCFMFSHCRANSQISELQRSKAAEIAKLTALLRKSEMRISSLERSVEQKVEKWCDVLFQHLNLNLKPIIMSTVLRINFFLKIYL